MQLVGACWCRSSHRLLFVHQSLHCRVHFHGAKDHNIVKSWVHEPSQDSCSSLESRSPAASTLRGMDCGNRAGMRRRGCGEHHQEARLLSSFPALLMQLRVSTCSLFPGLQLWDRLWQPCRHRSNASCKEGDVKRQGCCHPHHASLASGVVSDVFLSNVLLHGRKLSCTSSHQSIL